MVSFSKLEFIDFNDLTKGENWFCFLITSFKSMIILNNKLWKLDVGKEDLITLNDSLMSFDLYR